MQSATNAARPATSRETARRADVVALLAPLGSQAAEPQTGGVVVAGSKSRNSSCSIR